MSVDQDKYGEVAQLGMRLANLRKDGSYVLGAETEEGVLDVPATAAALGLLAPQDIDELLQHGLGAEVRVVADAAARQPDAAVVVRALVSGILPMQPGDVLFTGTPQGVIWGKPGPPEKKQWLKPGDVVVSELEGLGSLTVTLA